MSNLALIGVDITHNAVTSCRDALVSLGHTVTLVTDAAALGGHDFSGYDAVLTSRTDAANNAAMATLLNSLNDSGKPLIVGPMVSGIPAGVYGDNLTAAMGITGPVTILDGNTTQNVRANVHKITDGLTSGAQTLFSNNWVGGAGTHLGTAFLWGIRTTLAGLTTGAAILPGTPRLTTGTTGARVVIFPTYLLSGAYNALHTNMLGKSVEWAVTGAVTGANAGFLNSDVSAYTVLDEPEDAATVPMLDVYTILDIEHANVYSSGFDVYTILDSAVLEIKVGNVIGMQNDTWGASPTSFSYRWFRHANAEDLTGVAIAGATSETYPVAPEDEGLYLSGEKTPINASGTGVPVRSNIVGAILPADASTLPLLIEAGEVYEIGALSISGTPVLTATEGAAYTGFTVTAADGPEPWVFSLVGTWPAGITIDSVSGAVSGTPTENGTFAGLSVRVTDAAGQTADLPTFSIEVAVADPYVDPKFSLALEFEGADASTTITDLSSYGHTATVGGDAQISGNALLLDGTGDYVSFPDNAAFTFGSGDFAIEFDITPASLSNPAAQAYILGQFNTATNQRGYAFYITTTGNLVFQTNTSGDSGGGVAGVLTTLASMSTTTPTNIRVVRSAGTITHYVNDVSVGETIRNVTLHDSSAPFTIGCQGNLTGFFAGKLDNITVIKGATA